MPKLIKHLEYTKSNFSTLNAHADCVVDNEKQLARLKRFRADRVWIKNTGVVLLILGVFAILLAIAYNQSKAPRYGTVEKPIYIDKPIKSQKKKGYCKDLLFLILRKLVKMA